MSEIEEANSSVADKRQAKSQIRPRKSLGQHYLKDVGIRDIIIDSADISQSDVILEVGPGLGVLTSELVKRAGRVIAIELDGVLVKRLQSKFAAYHNLEIINADILRVDLENVMGKHVDYKVVANIPYYITSPILHLFTESEYKPKLMVVMMQKEVAAAVLAKPGKMSFLSVSMQVRSNPEKVCDVLPQYFYPPPKVESTVVKFNLLDKPCINVDDMQCFFKVVQAGFDAPRKQLRNSLSQGLKIDVSASTEILRGACIEPSRRAETLTLPEWEKLYHQVIHYPQTIIL